MTTGDELTVYGRPLGSLWDRRIGGRYELTAIHDNGGTGMWVTLQRVDGGHELAVSVYNLGRNYVTVPDKAEPAEGEVPASQRDPNVAPTDAERDRIWQQVAAEQAAIRTAEPAEDGRSLPYDAVDLAPAYLDVRPNVPWPRPPAVPEPVEPTDVPLAAWEIEHLGREADPPVSDDLALARGLLEYALHLCVNGERAPGGDETWAEFARNAETWLRAPLATAPPLPWVEHPDAWWQHADGDRAYPSRNLVNSTYEEVGDWQRVAVIPADLIEKLRQGFRASDYGAQTDKAAKAILDAADEVTS